MLAACSDPLDQVPKLSEIDVAAPSPVVEAAAAPVEIDENTGFFQRLMRKRTVGDAGEAGSAPGSELPNEAAESPAAEIVENDLAPKKPAAAQKRGFRLFGRKASESPLEPGPVGGTASTVATPATANVEIADTQEQPAVEPSVEPSPEPRKAGFLGGLFSRQAAKPAPEKVELASQPADVGKQAKVETPAKRKRGGLFGMRRSLGASGPAMDDATPGEVLPFGKVARACHMRRQGLGRMVSKYPERSGKYKIFDSAPGNMGLHSFYLTGFGDGCPRQFTAALAVFGSVGMHEALRYGLPDEAKPWSETDKAYEKVKSRVCHVGRKRPCGAKIRQLERGTVFVSIYNRFEGAQGWSNILLHDGAVLAQD